MTDIRTDQPKQSEAIIAMSSCLDPKLLPCKFANSTAIGKNNNQANKENKSKELITNLSSDSKFSNQYLRRYQRYREIEKRLKFTSARKNENIIPINKLMVDRDILESNRPAYNTEDLIESYKRHAERNNGMHKDDAIDVIFLTNADGSKNNGCYRKTKPLESPVVQNTDKSPTLSQFTNNTSNAVKAMLKNAKERSISNTEALIGNCEKLKTFKLLENGYKDVRVNSKETITSNRSDNSTTYFVATLDKTNFNEELFNVKSESLKERVGNNKILDNSNENEIKLTGWNRVREGVNQDLSKFKQVLENSSKVNTCDIIKNSSLTKSQIDLLSKDERLHQIFIENRVKSFYQESKIGEMEKKMIDYEEKINVLYKQIETLQENMKNLDITTRSKDLLIKKQNYIIKGMKESNCDINAALNEVSNVMDLHQKHF